MKLVHFRERGERLGVIAGAFFKLPQQVIAARTFQLFRHLLQCLETFGETFGAPVPHCPDEIDDILANTALLDPVDQLGQLVGAVGELEHDREAERGQVMGRVHLQDPPVGLLRILRLQDIELLPGDDDGHLEVGGVALVGCHDCFKRFLLAPKLLPDRVQFPKRLGVLRIVLRHLAKALFSFVDLPRARQRHRMVQPDRRGGRVELHGSIERFHARFGVTSEAAYVAEVVPCFPVVGNGGNDRFVSLDGVGMMAGFLREIGTNSLKPKRRVTARQILGQELQSG